MPISIPNTRASLMFDLIFVPFVNLCFIHSTDASRLCLGEQSGDCADDRGLREPRRRDAALPRLAARGNRMWETWRCHVSTTTERHLRIRVSCDTLSKQMTSPAKQPPAAQASIGKSAFLVASAILLSRIAGLVRGRALAHFFGISYIADAFGAAGRIPTILQNLFGEGVLSPSFIPVYAELVAQGEKDESGRVAGAVFSILALIASVLVLVGVLATPWLIALIDPGFRGETRRLTIQLVRIFFPGVGLLVLSAWCLGILNSHRKFFLSYASPVVWNLAIIVALIVFGRRVDLSQLAVVAAWASVVGSALQFLIQVPVVFRLVPGIRFFFGSLSDNVRSVGRSFVPVFITRGAVQLSAYVDAFLASFLPTSAVTPLTNAQALYLLPVSLFGMSISVAELPAMSSALVSDQ